MIFRAATSADLDALLDVQEEGAVHGLRHLFPQDRHPFPRSTIAARWRAELAAADVGVYVGTDGADAVQGFAATQGAELLHFGTARRTWGTGLASELHDAVLATFGQPVGGTLSLRVFVENRRARRFYEKHGWWSTGTTSRTDFPPHPLLLEYRRPRPGDGPRSGPRVVGRSPQQEYGQHDRHDEQDRRDDQQDQPLLPERRVLRGEA